MRGAPEGASTSSRGGSSVRFFSIPSMNHSYVRTWRSSRAVSRGHSTLPSRRGPRVDAPSPLVLPFSFVVVFVCGREGSSRRFIFTRGDSHRLALDAKRRPHSAPREFDESERHRAPALAPVRGDGETPRHPPDEIERHRGDTPTAGETKADDGATARATFRFPIHTRVCRPTRRARRPSSPASAPSRRSDGCEATPNPPRNPTSNKTPSCRTSPPTTRVSTSPRLRPRTARVRARSPPRRARGRRTRTWRPPQGTPRT